MSTVDKKVKKERRLFYGDGRDDFFSSEAGLSFEPGRTGWMMVIGSLRVLCRMPSNPDPTAVGDSGITSGSPKLPTALNGIEIKLPPKMLPTSGMILTMRSTVLNGATSTIRSTLFSVRSTSPSMAIAIDGLSMEVSEMISLPSSNTPLAVIELYAKPLPFRSGTSPR